MLAARRPTHHDVIEAPTANKAGPWRSDRPPPQDSKGKKLKELRTEAVRAGFKHQRFAAVFSLWHEKADLDLHARLRQRVNLFIRERVRI